MGSRKVDKKYSVEFSKMALEDLSKIKKSGTNADKTKLERIIKELEIHPKEGIGHPKPLIGQEGEVWSRKLNKKDRIVYEILEKEVVVFLFQLLGHYNDK